MYLSPEKDGLNSMTKGEIESNLWETVISSEIVKKINKTILPKIQVTGKIGKRPKGIGVGIQSSGRKKCDLAEPEKHSSRSS